METLSPLFQRFLRERRYLKNVTPKTVIWYGTATRKVCSTDLLRSPGRSLCPVPAAFANAGCPRCPETYLKAINSFLGWLHAEGHLAQALAMTPQRTEKRVVRTLSDEHLKRLLAFKPKTATQWRAFATSCLQNGGDVVRLSRVAG